MLKFIVVCDLEIMVLTAQGTPFIHSGQEYGRTKTIP